MLPRIAMGTEWVMPSVTEDVFCAVLSAWFNSQAQ